MGWRDDSSPGVGGVPATPATPATPSSGSGWRNQSTPGATRPAAAPSAASAPTGEIAQPDTLPPLNPLTATTGDYLAKLHQATGGLSEIGSRALDYARVAGSTFGLYDRMAGDNTGFAPDASGRYVQGGSVPDLDAANAASLAAERAKTAEARARLGPFAYAADLTGGGPIGKLGAATKLADVAAPVTGKWLGGVLASGTEGGALSATAAAGRGEDPVSAGLWGTLFGTAGGLPGGVASRPPNTGVRMPTTDKLRTASSTANTKLEGVHFDPASVDTAFNGVDYALSKGDASRMSPSLRSAVDTISQQISRGGSVTADDIAKFQRSLSGASRGDNDIRIASKFSNALDGVLSNERPLTGAAPGQAKSMVDAANAAGNIYKTSRSFDQWAQDPAKAPAAVRSAIESKPQFYQQPGLADEMTKIGRMWGQSPVGAWMIHHAVLPAILGGVGTITGGPERGLEYGAGGFLASQGIKSGGDWVARKRVADALLNAQHLAITGQPAPGGSTVGRNLLRATATKLGIAGDVP